MKYSLVSRKPASSSLWLGLRFNVYTLLFNDYRDFANCLLLCSVLIFILNFCIFCIVPWDCHRNCVCSFNDIEIACMGWQPVFCGCLCDFCPQPSAFLIGFYLFVPHFAERLDQDMSGILTTICNHSFHCSCISMWADSSCPVSFSLLVAHTQLFTSLGNVWN